MATPALSAELQGQFHAPTAEQAAGGWSQDWTAYWTPHEAKLAAGGHAPTPAQAAQGWSQNWDAWKTAPDETFAAGGRLVCVDFTGGATVRAAREQASKETEAFQQQELKGASPPPLAPANARLRAGAPAVRSRRAPCSARC